MKKKECHMIPAEEKKCIWMNAGLISYKLCTREYRCEECVFDQVMRNEMDIHATPLLRNTASERKHFEAAASHWTRAAALFYHQNHCWVKVESTDEVRIGIDGLLARLLSRIKAVVLPQCGESMVQNQCFGHIILEHHILQLIAPVSGTVTAVNPALRSSTQLLTHDPWDDGWLVVIRPDNLEHDLRSLLFGKKALAWYRAKEQLIENTFAAYLNRSDDNLGTTLQDGGEQIFCVAEMLSPEQFELIIEALSQIENHAV